MAPFQQASARPGDAAGRPSPGGRAPLAAVMMLAALTGCESTRQGPDLSATGNTIGDKIERPAPQRDREDAIDEESAEPGQKLKRPFQERFKSTGVPSLTEPAREEERAAITPPEPGKETVDAAVPSMELPRFIDVVFGEMLELPYSTGPKIADRSEVIQLRSSGQMKADAFLRLVAKALKSYGVRVSPEEEMYVIMSSESAMQRRPQFIRSRGDRSTPADLRPVVQFVRPKAISAVSMENLLRQAFPRDGDLKTEIDRESGSLVITGLPEDVEAALDIINSMDELEFADSNVVAYEPVYWRARDLSTKLQTVLGSEGWEVSSGDQTVSHIHLVSVAFSNTLLAFVKSQEAYDRVRHWLEFLDKPKESGEGDRIFIYDVENADAELIAEIANSVLEGTEGPGRGEDQQAQQEGQQQDGQQAGEQDGESQFGGGNLVTDPHGNRLIYTGSPSQYQRILPLLERLDQPVPEVLIEVTIAEVTLTDETDYGVEFFAENVGGDGVDVDFGTEGGLGLGTSGFTAGFVSGDVTAALNAFAQNQRVDVLSTPRLVARSGGSASIQVGTDVPVITSQQAADEQSGQGGTDVFQQVQFRETGVLTNIEPIVFGSGRVDLNISQEVSNAQPNPNAAIASPIIQNRNLTTQLTLKDGGTAVLGGLIQDNVTRGNTGIPLLKDIPGLGALFSVNSLSVERTELLMIITAYVMRSGEDRKRFVDHLTEQINDSLADPFQMRTRLPRQAPSREVGEEEMPEARDDSGEGDAERDEGS